MTNRKSARAVADLSRGVVHAVVEIDAPPDRVFEALTRADEVPQWWGSDDTYRVTEWTGDLRVGGAWKSVGRGSDGHPFSVGGEYLEIDAPRLLVHSWKPDWEAGEATIVRYEIQAVPGGSRVTVRHEGFGARAESCQSHTEGWEGVFGWLTKHLVPKAASKAYFLARLIGPRATFPMDMTPEERELMSAHAAYSRGLMSEGFMLAFGPVGDPKGVWGLGLLAVRDVAHAHELQQADPVIRADRGFHYETLPFLSLVHP